MTLTRTLSEIGLETDADGIRPEAYAAAKKMVLDTLGCALAGWNAPGVTEVVEQMCDWGGKPEATILFRDQRLPAPNVVLANSAMIHALDYDDVHIPGVLHIMSVILPVALAAGEMADASGKDVLAAVIMGVEVAGRLGIAYQSRCAGPQGAGLLPTSVVGGFGAVAAICRLLSRSVDECVNAMGINYAQVSGNRQALLDMTLTKRLQPGFAARSAMEAVMLAARRVTGPHNALEGRAGLFRVYQNAEPATSEELAQPREMYEIERVSVKRYTSCGACHHAQIATERLVEEEGLQPEDVARVELYGCGPGGLVGNPFVIGPNPQVCAQFSVQYGVALTLLRGQATLEHFTDEQVLANQDVAELAQQITFTKEVGGLPDPSVGKVHAVIVHTRDDRHLVRWQTREQTFAPDAMLLEDVIAKFRDCAAFSGICPPEQADQIVASVQNLDGRERVSEALARWRLDVG